MNPAPIVVLAVYRVPVKLQAKFSRIVSEKREYFLKAGYRTSREPIFLRSGSSPEFLIDIFEWTSELAIERAHSDPVVQRYWSEMESLWIDGGLGLSQLPESDEAFAGFEPVAL
jgi:hypothetical protein